MKLNLLALETSTNVCDVTLLSSHENNINIHNNSNDSSNKHAEFLFDLIDKTLAKAKINRNQISAVVFGQGPGGFTGLRISCGVAQGVAYALNIPVVAISSLMTIALQAHKDQTPKNLNKCLHIVMQDARMNELYVAAYMAVNKNLTDNNSLSNNDLADIDIQELHQPMLIGIDDINIWVAQILSNNTDVSVLVSGDALDLNNKIGQDLKNLSDNITVGKALKANADALAILGLQKYKLGQVISAQDAAPLYVREKVAFTIKERNAGASGNPNANQQ